MTHAFRWTLGAALSWGVASLVLSAPVRAQAASNVEGTSPKATTAPKAAKEPKASGEKKVPRLFQSSAPMTLTFTTNIKQLRRDKSAAPPSRWASLTYVDSAKGAVTVPLRVHTRGIWRLKNCVFPPLRLNFDGKSTKDTDLHGLGKPKLVNYCKDTDSYEQYILQELQLYRVYQLITPVSHRVRLVRLTYVDSASGKHEAERYAMIVEDPEELATRLSTQAVKTRGATAEDLDHPQLALAYLFQYFIGNLDFSFAGLHNTEVLATADGRMLPVAYDFDFSGAVNASYATPPPDMGLRGVRTRRFLGPCAVVDDFPVALERFKEKKDAIYALYHDEVGSRMNQDVVRETLRYFDDFYDETRTPERAKHKLFASCVRPN
jgi:hypothetical protein